MWYKKRSLNIVLKQKRICLNSHHKPCMVSGKWSTFHFFKHLAIIFFSVACFLGKLINFGIWIYVYMYFSWYKVPGIMWSYVIFINDHISIKKNGNVWIIIIEFYEEKCSWRFILSKRIGKKKLWFPLREYYLW